MALFVKRPPKCPVDDETRKFIDDAFAWMVAQFGLKKLPNKKVLIPTKRDFPFKSLVGSSSAAELLKFIGKQMDLDPRGIAIAFFDDDEPDERSLPEGKWEHHGVAGLYLGNLKDGRSMIALEAKHLQDPVGLVATLAHELAHVRILGEKRKLRKDPSHEYYADLLSIFFGFGLFVAAAAFRTSGWLQGMSAGWSQRSEGYLSLREIGYALALHAKMRNETNPSWRRFVSGSVVHYFDQAAKLLKYESKEGSG